MREVDLLVDRRSGCRWPVPTVVVAHSPTPSMRQDRGLVERRGKNALAAWLS